MNSALMFGQELESIGVEALRRKSVLPIRGLRGSFLAYAFWSCALRPQDG